MRELDRSIQTVWGLQYGLVAVAGAGMLFFYELIHLFEGSVLPLPFGVSSLLILAIGAGGGTIWARLRRRCWKYELRDEEIYLRRGVLNRIHTVVPLRRIQHLDVSQNILEREWELARLVIYTAGTRQNSVSVPGLPLEEARSMRDRIRQFVLDRSD